MSDQVQIIEDVSWWSTDKPAFDPWQIIALSAAAVLLVAIAIVYIRRRKLAVPFFAAPPPDEVALKALRELETNMAEERHAEFVVRVSQILRTYIQDRFHLRAMHRSTEEF